MNGEFSDYPVIPARIVVQRHSEKVDILRTETGRRTGSNVVLTNLYRLGFRESLIVARVSSLVKSSSVAVKPAAIGRQLSGSVETPVLPISILADRTGAISPKQIEGIAFGSALAVFYPDHCGSIAVAGVAGQGLPSPAIHACEPEVRWIRRHGPSTFKAPPRWSLAPGIPKSSGISPNLDVGRLIHHNFNGALAPVRIPAVYKNCFALQYLSCHGPGRDDYSDQESPFAHHFHLWHSNRASGLPIRES